MIRNLISFSAACLMISFGSSLGFSQEYYQSLPTYSAPISNYQPSQTFSASVNYQPYSVQYSTPVYSAPQTYSTPTVGFSGTQTFYGGSYGGINGSVFSGQGVTGYNASDIGYDGPGDMRTHLWEAHAHDLRANGVSHGLLMSMPMSTVQQWHNFFHGTQGRPH